MSAARPHLPVPAAFVRRIAVFEQIQPNMNTMLATPMTTGLFPLPVMIASTRRAGAQTMAMAPNTLLLMCISFT